MCVLPAEAVEENGRAGRDVLGESERGRRGEGERGRGRLILIVSPSLPLLVSLSRFLPLSRHTIRHIVPIAIRNEHQIRSRSDPDAAEAEFQAADEVQPLDEDRAFLKRPVAVGVFENDDLVFSLALLRAVGIGVSLRHPQAAARIDRERNRLMDERLTSRQLHLEAIRHRHRGGGLGRCETLAHRHGLLRLSRFELLLSHLGQLVPQNVRTLHPTDHDIGQLVPVDVTDAQLPSDAGFAVGEVRHPVDLRCVCFSCPLAPALRGEG